MNAGEFLRVENGVAFLRVEFEYVTVSAKGGRFDAECTKCGIGVEVGEWMGPIPGHVLIAEFVKQHAHIKASR